MRERFVMYVLCVALAPAGVPWWRGAALAGWRSLPARVPRSRLRGRRCAPSSGLLAECALQDDGGFVLARLAAGVRASAAARVRRV